ncbi:MAG TPA: hypothetical protein VEU77_08930 [Candidatus Acidoferrales bacterium]|nr:hypothetical protein [Candidatus Acidoferrales bacterium]
MVDALGSAETSVLFTDEEKATIAASVELTKTAQLSEQTLARLRRFFDDRQLVEFVVNTSIANLNNRITDTFNAEIDPE